MLAEAEEYAARDYPWVLSRGDRLTAKERAEAVAKLARLTGLTEDYVDRADLRIEHWRFFGELLRDERRAVGRLDGRFTGPAAAAIAEEMDADPSHDAIPGPYAAAFNHYVRAELGYESDLPYEQISPTRAPVVVQGLRGPADRRRRRKLERAMRQNPHLKVHVAYGYYDGATPHFAAEDVDRPPADARRAAGEHRARLLRGRAHDVRPRAVPGAAEQGPRGVRPRRACRLGFGSQHGGDSWRNQGMVVQLFATAASLSNPSGPPA